MGGVFSLHESARPFRKVQNESNKNDSIVENSSIGKNKHIEHLEDEIINSGLPGLKSVIETLTAVHSMLSGKEDTGYSISEKWDGAPAIICGKDPETGNFVMGDKGIFSTRSNNKIFSLQDIANIKPDKEINGQVKTYQGLRNKLSTVFPLLASLNLDDVIQGDLMYTKSDLKQASINGRQYIIFRPNTITYAVPVDSELAQKIVNSEAGMVFHTKYTGGIDLSTMKANYGFNATELASPSALWITDANINGQLKNVKIDQLSSNKIFSSIQVLSKVANSMENDALNLDDGSIQELKTFINYMIKETGRFEQDLSKFVNNFMGWAQARSNPVTIDPKKLASLYNLYLAIIRIKISLLSYLRSVKLLDTFIQHTDGSFTPTSSEGYVVVDQFGKAIKLVNRLEFSRFNFLLPKNWN